MKATGLKALLSNAAVAERLQSILINAAEGRRSITDDSAYGSLRKVLMRKKLELPSFLLTHPSVDSFSAFIRGIDVRSERVERVRNDFAPLLQSLGSAEAGTLVDSSGWTGKPSRAERLTTVRMLLPLAQSAVDSMIATLSEPNANGGPLLDGREEALKNLRELHKTLGELLKVVDADQLDSGLGQKLQAEAAQYAKRTAKALRDDPMPYLSSALLLGLFTACGLPGLGGYMTGVALAVKKHAGKA